MTTSPSKKPRRAKRPRGDLTELWTYEFEGSLYELELEIDRKWIVVQLARRAIRNTGQKASQVAGAVIVRVKGKK